MKILNLSEFVSSIEESRRFRGYRVYEAIEQKGKGVNEPSDEAEQEKLQEFTTKLLDALKKQKDLTSYVKAMNTILDGSGVKDKDNTKLYLKVITDIFSGQIDDNNKKLYDKYTCAGEQDIPVKELYPTQSEIDIENSAKWATKDWGAKGVDNMFSNKGFGTSFPVPVLVYNDGKKNWIIDGHHRWSQVALINPEAKLHCMIVKGNQPVQEFLKLTQSVIAGVIAERGKGETLPVGKAQPNNNIFGSSLKGDKLGEKVKDMLNQNDSICKILQEKLKSHTKEITGENSQKEFTPEDIANLVVKNRDLMVERGQQPESWAADRPVMPQSDKAGVHGEQDSSPESKDSALNKLKNIEGLPDIG